MKELNLQKVQNKLRDKFLANGVKMLGPEMYQQLRETKGMEHDGLLLPKEIAKTDFHLAQQHRSAWTHEIDLRAVSDLAWWNHASTLAIRED